jgi:hypothetical protein
VNRSLSELGNDEVARLILRKLWQLQDAGGVSMGRSPRSVFLESAINILPMPVRNCDAFGTQELLEEVKKRRASIPPKLGSVRYVRRIGKRTLAILLLQELLAWYREDAKKDPQQALTVETRMTETVLRLMPLPRGFKRSASWSAEALVEQSRIRLRIASNRRFKRRFGY